MGLQFLLEGDGNMSGLMDAITRYWYSLSTYLMREWNTMTPAKYGTLLILVGVFGWLFMKSGTKKPGT